MVLKLFRLHSHAKEIHFGFNMFNVMTIQIWFISEIPKVEWILPIKLSSKVVPGQRQTTLRTTGSYLVGA